MKPNFALDLTFDAITLLHRAGEAGWHVVGEVALDSPLLGADLAALRKKANTLDPSGMHTAIIIPDEQIRYLDIPAASAPHGRHDAAAADALDGATPYALDELAYDWTVSGARLQIAAVARETLDEAESFAREHKLNPVCFMADPDPSLYAGAPFFGMAGEAAATGEVAERDTGPMKRLGALPDARADTADDADAAPPLSFASIRAERGLPPKPAARLEGVARITPAPSLPDAEARAISGAARASLEPRQDGSAPGPTRDAAPGPTTGTPAPPLPPAKTPTAPASRKRTAPTPPSAAPPDKAAADAAIIPPGAGKTAAGSDATALTPGDEAERLTIFGARTKTAAQRGKPRFLGLILTAALLIVLVGVAAWAAIFPDSGLGRLLRGSEPQIAVTPDIPEIGTATAPPASAPTAPAPVLADPDTDTDTDTPAPVPQADTPEIAALPAAKGSDTAPEENAAANEPGTGDEAAPDAAKTGWTAPRTPEEARRRYAATGIWPSAPKAPDDPRSDSLDSFYQTSIDAQLALRDAIALPPARGLAPDAAPSRAAPPPPPGRTFDLDARGLVRATPDGALTAEGVRVYAGPPPVRPPDTPPRVVPLPGLTPTDAAAEARETLSGTRPRTRPQGLIEEHERGAFGGRTRTELASLRPLTRPAAIAARADAEAVAEAVAAAAEEAVAESLKPRLRPQQIARAAPPRGTTAAPAIPTSASIAQRATTRNAINLRQVNLIGVYGTPSDRRALVRLSNGRYRKVQVGDRIDGGRVSAIGDTELRYTRSGRNVVLRMPKG